MCRCIHILSLGSSLAPHTIVSAQGLSDVMEILNTQIHNMMFRESEHKVTTRSATDAPTTCRQLRKSISFRNYMHGKRFVKRPPGAHAPRVITRGPPMACSALTFQNIRGESTHGL